MCAPIDPIGFAVASIGIEMSEFPISGFATPSWRYCGYPRWYVAVMTRTIGSAIAMKRARLNTVVIRPCNMV